MSAPIVAAGAVLLAAGFAERVQPIDAIDALDPDFKARFVAFTNAAAKEGHPLEVLETRRTLERQVWLWTQGRLRPGDIVTYALTKGRHLRGVAADTWPRGYGYSKAEAPTVQDILMRLAPLAAQHGLKNLPQIGDYGHWEDI